MGQNNTQTRLKRLVVVLDPSSPTGASGADLASALVGEDGELTLVVALNGPETSSLHAYADSEQLSIKDAASIYVDQVASRLVRQGVDVTLIDGTDLATDLVDLVEGAGAQGVVLPAAMAARAMATKLRWTTFPFPVVAVPESPMAA